MNNFKKSLRYICLLLISIVVFLSQLSIASSEIKADETVIIFPSTGYLDQKTNHWIIPIHGWIFELENSSIWQSSIIATLKNTLELTDDENSYFKQRVQQFLVDNERGKKIHLKINDISFQSNSSRENGHFYAEMKLENSGHYFKNPDVTIKAHDKDELRTFEGIAQLIQPKGISVISDIDDTIKLSNVRDKKALLHNTFLEKFQAISGMSNVYQAWKEQGAKFHYVSASPWQLYPALHTLLTEENFPLGDFHLKHLRLTDQTIFNLFTAPEDYKISIINEILARFPERQFILVGDSGEKDPEIYANIEGNHPDQVLHIFIRNVDNENNESERFKNAFSKTAKSKWTVFSKPEKLLTFEINQ